MAFYIPPHRSEPIPLPYIELSSLKLATGSGKIASRVKFIITHRIVRYHSSNCRDSRLVGSN